MEQQITVIDSVWYYWAFFLLAAITGSIASSLTNNNGKAIMCGWEGGNSREENGNPGKYCLGIIADILIGIAAALGILWTLAPQTVFQLIGIGTVAGYGGSSILRALTNKLDAQTNKFDAQTSKLDAQLSQQKANEFEKIAKENEDKAKENKDEADTNKTIAADTINNFLEKRENISAIKDYLLKYHNEVLNELYNKKLIN